MARAGSAQARVAAVVLAGVAWLWLAVFLLRLFPGVSHRSGGASHVAFRTAAIEPKLAALETIVQAGAEGRPVGSRSGPQRQIWIVADSWWSYWPLAYFSARRHDIHVVAARRVAGREPAGCRGRRPVAGRSSWRPTRRRLPTGAAVAEDRPAGKTTIRDYAGAPLLTVERLEPRKIQPTAAAAIARPRGGRHDPRGRRFDIGRK